MSPLRLFAVLGEVRGAFFSAFGALVRNKTRAALTVLGILIGVAAVVIVTATQSSGAKSKSVGRLTENDGRAVAREGVSVAGVAYFLSGMGQVVYADKNSQTAIYGVNLPYFWIRKFEIEKGDLWNDTDELVKTKVVVLGPTVATNLFGTEDPIGRVIRVGRSPFRVVGVTKARGTSLFGEDQDDRIFMPVGSFRARVLPTSPGRVDMLMAASTSEDTTDRASRQVEAILRQRHHIRQDAEPDFQIRTQADLREVQQSITGVLSLLLIGVAAISLVVGGIGVMNIMLVSVAERTREIGIRMSIGARERDILVQFLVEAVVLSLVGGLLGMALGSGITVGLGRALDWPMSPSLTALALAVFTSGSIGVAFGFFPARRAAKLDPIEALRTE
jgi:putative ABC transport system permease protein